jgi:Helix-turn-helix domain of resolvase
MFVALISNIIARQPNAIDGATPLQDVRQGKYPISDLAELFSISRPTVYRTLTRATS